MSRVVLVGASGLAREVMASLAASGQHEVVGVLDDDETLAGQLVHGVPVLGPIAQAARVDAELVVCVGGGAGRRAIVHRLSEIGVGADQYATVIDPSVSGSARSAIGPGSVLLAQCVLTADVTIGRHVVAMPHVTLTHDDVIEDHATLCAGVTLGGSVRVGAAAYLGMRSAVRQNLGIGADAVLGMGAVLLDDLPAGQTWVGCPARPLVPRGTALQEGPA